MVEKLSFLEFLGQKPVFLSISTGGISETETMLDTKLTDILW